MAICSWRNARSPAIRQREAPHSTKSFGGFGPPFALITLDGAISVFPAGDTKFDQKHDKLGFPSYRGIGTRWKRPRGHLGCKTSTIYPPECHTAGRGTLARRLPEQQSQACHVTSSRRDTSWNKVWRHCRHYFEAPLSGSPQLCWDIVSSH